MKEKKFLLGSIFKPLIIKVDNVKLSHYWVTALSTQHHPLKYYIFYVGRECLFHSAQHTFMINSYS